MLAATLLALALAPTPPDPAALLARVKQATGGSAWNGVRTLHARSTLETGGLKGPVELWEDLTTGRSVTRYKLGPASGAGGFDGKTVWTQDSSGQVKTEEGGD